MNCNNCHSPFQVTDEDRKFYSEISPVIRGQKYLIPEPTLCPSCRQQRRMAYRNERTLFKRSCDRCQKSFISIYSPDSPYAVYCKDCWWSDGWSALDYGQDFDFSRPFFEQFNELMLKVPKMGMLQLQVENSDYNSLLAYSKNVYLSPGSYFLEDCYFMRKSQYSKNCIDASFIDHCELTSNAVNSSHCYNAHYLIDCRGCSDSYYLADCIGCKNCLMCSGLSNKEFYIKNRPVTPQEFQKQRAEIRTRDPEELWEEFNEFNQTIPKKYQNQINCQDSSGDYIQNCKNAIECYDSFNLEDCKYAIGCVDLDHCMDQTTHDMKGSFCYEICSGGDNNHKVLFSFCSCATSDSQYVFSCFYATDCFGCDGLHQKQSYCILNKQYTKEEYERLVPKMIEHMSDVKSDSELASEKKTGEYGEYFPVNLSPFAYNHTIAQDFHPLSKNQVIEKGWKWRDDNEMVGHNAKTIKKGRLPHDISKIPDDVLNWAIECKGCEKKYKIIKQELHLSRRLNLSLSPYCADCRYLKLFHRKNPPKLFDRKCSACSKDIQTTYAPKRPERVLCESCYLKEVY